MLVKNNVLLNITKDKLQKAFLDRKKAIVKVQKF